MFATGLLSPLPSLAALCLRLACLLAAIAVGDRMSFYIRKMRDGEDGAMMEVSAGGFSVSSRYLDLRYAST